MRRSWVAIGFAIAAVVVAIAAYLASGDPDGLERVAGEQGFEDAGQAPPFEIIADYVFPGLDGPIATILAGLIGVVIVFGVAWLVGRMLARRRTAADPR